MSAQAVESLPKVSGRHQNKALASARKLRAIELKTQGLTYQQVADEMGYANKGSVHAIIKGAQAAQVADAVETHRQLELERLDRLQAALWPKAMKGQIDAASAILRIIEARVRLLGLHAAGVGRGAKNPKDVWDSCQGPPTVVVRKDDCRHGGCDTHGQFRPHSADA